MATRRLMQSDQMWLEELRREGATVLRNRLMPSVLHELDRASEDMLVRWKEGLVDDKDYWTCPGPDDVEVLYRIHRFETKWSGTLALLRVPAIRGILGSLFGGHSRPTQMALCVKLPMVGAPVPWHRDPIKARPGTVFNLSIYLDDSFAANGCLEVVPGSHFTPHIYPLGEPAGLVPMPAARGDIIVHDVNVNHGSRANRSTQLRRSLVVEFCRATPGSVTAGETL